MLILKLLLLIFSLFRWKWLSNPLFLVLILLVFRYNSQPSLDDAKYQFMILKNEVISCKATNIIVIIANTFFALSAIAKNISSFCFRKANYVTIWNDREFPDITVTIRPNEVTSSCLPQPRRSYEVSGIKKEVGDIHMFIHMLTILIMHDKSTMALGLIQANIVTTHAPLRTPFLKQNRAYVQVWDLR